MRRDMKGPGRIVVVRIGRWLRRGYAALVALSIRSRMSGSVLRRLPWPVRHRTRRAIPAYPRAVATQPFATPPFGALRPQGRPVAGVEGRGRPALVDSVGDAVAVVAALLQSVGGPR